MSHTEDDEWNADETSALRTLGQEGGALPPALKPAVVRRLSALGLLAPSTRLRAAVWGPWAAAAVLAVIAFGLGRGLGVERRSGTESSTRYVLLLTGAGSTTPEENAARRLEYGVWLAGLQRRGMLADGAELVGTRHELPEEGRNEPVVGYFVINARDESEALAIARGNPHLRHGGGVTVAALR
jgi:hypothetical protein